ncbi:thermospermine synthase ACAULIS5-like isoform X2 [Euphorbia lathyris]|uniref:thermospermine synthase ACAULIS5-like isoform X2 n=1 Tax=Euphorbia lathyris TaxID=212925 RepID=UPI003313FF00
MRFHFSLILLLYKGEIQSLPPFLPHCLNKNKNKMGSFLSSSRATSLPSSTKAASTEIPAQDQWFEEQLEVDLKWSFQLNRVLHETTSEYQDIVLLDSKPFGKVLVLDGKLQSAEKDEFIYHECLVHPALLLHPNPKSVFIMGGGEGSTAREVLKHNGIQKVVMCDIDKVVVDFCRMHLTANQEAFSNEKLHVVFNDAKNELEKRNEKYDIIIGDLADPIEGGPCNHLYTKSFYEQVIKTKLNHSGIFVTQAGTAGVLSHKVVFSSIHNTVKQVFKREYPTKLVLGYSDGDTRCGCIHCSHSILCRFMWMGAGFR